MSWAQLEAILAAMRQEREPQEPTACPNDGEPLLVGPDGGLYCPFDGWRPS